MRPLRLYYCTYIRVCDELNGTNCKSYEHHLYVFISSLWRFMS